MKRSEFVCCFPLVRYRTSFFLFLSFYHGPFPSFFVAIFSRSIDSFFFFSFNRRRKERNLEKLLESNKPGCRHLCPRTIRKGRGSVYPRHGGGGWRGGTSKERTSLPPSRNVSVQHKGFLLALQRANGSQTAAVAAAAPAAPASCPFRIF